MVEIDKKSPLDEQSLSLILRDNNLKAWQRRIHDDEQFARVFFRDANIIKRMGTASERNVETIFLLRKYGSKTRSEVHILERRIGSEMEEEIHQHWHSFMPDPEVVFPYLSLAPECDEEDEFDDYWDEDEILEWHPLQLSTGKRVHPYGRFELVEYRMRAKLNDLGQAWLQTLEVMEAAGFIEIDMEAKTFVSVAQWHARDV